MSHRVLSSPGEDKREEKQGEGYCVIPELGGHFTSENTI
jgi:hypothetical protein